MGSALVSCCLPLWVFGGGEERRGRGSVAIVAGSRSLLSLIQVLWWRDLSHSRAPHVFSYAG